MIADATIANIFWIKEGPDFHQSADRWNRGRGDAAIYDRLLSGKAMTRSFNRVN